MSGRAFYSLVLSFFTGVFIVSLWRESFILVCLVLVITCALWFARVKMPSLVIGCVVLCVLGAGRTELSYSGVHPLDTLPGVIEGVVCDEPQRKDLVQKFCFAPDKSPDRILVTRAKYPTFSYGDRLRLEGKLEFPENFETDGGIEFDYISYLAKDDIRYIMYRPKAELVSHDNGNVLVSVLYSIRSAFIRKMQDLFPEPESSLLGGVLLGDRSSLPQDISDEFRNAGLVHILVLSGSNVTVVAESLMKAFAFLPRMIGQLFGAVSIVLFALMTGASATTVRASIMALVVIVA
ncbi:MAG TPA: ComEC family competence protein, partial [Candidatus Paceibacterota bacterium]